MASLKATCFRASSLRSGTYRNHLPNRHRVHPRIFDHAVSITKHNLRLWDALKSIKQDTLEKDLAKLFPEMKSVKQACIVRHD